jgi:DNA-binding transcriptional ArsR family regulator
MRDPLEPVWSALASPVRREILDRLRERPCTTGALAQHLAPLSRFAVMQHLRVLERAQLVVGRRQGRHRLNHLNPIPIRQVYERWVSRYSGAWSEALVSLKHRLESRGTRIPHSKGAG